MVVLVFNSNIFEQSVYTLLELIIAANPEQCQIVTGTGLTRWTRVHVVIVVYCRRLVITTLLTCTSIQLKMGLFSSFTIKMMQK